MARSRHGAAWLFTAIVGLAIATSVVIRLVAPVVTLPHTRIAVLAAPNQVGAGERVALYLGVVDVVEGARAEVRVCNENACPVGRVQPLEAASSSWTWLANAILPEGSHHGEVFVRVPTPFGMRTVDSVTWTMVALP